jgi:hypothetical protein
MASLTGQTIASTYDALLKVTDNGPITSSLKVITDGLGNNSALSLGTTSASINGNITANNLFDGFSSITASATQVVLTINSVPYYLVNGSGGQTIKLPDATTLPNGAVYIFNNNQSSGNILVNNNSNTLVVSIPSGGYANLELIDNTIAAGSWDRHFEAPSNVNWSTNTLDYAGSITSATWNGNAVAVNRGGTGASTASGAKANLSAENILTFSSPLSRAVDTISIPAATTSANGYLSSTDWNTFNGKQGALTNPITGSGTRSTGYLPIFSATNTITNSDILLKNTTQYSIDKVGASSIPTFTVDFIDDENPTSNYSFYTTRGVTNIRGNLVQLDGFTQLNGDLQVKGAITQNSNSGIQLNQFGTTTGGISGAVNITGSGKLSIANIGASGTLNVGSTTTATKRLEITGDNTGGAENNTLRFVNSDTTIGANEVIGKIEFYSADATAPGASVKAYISAGATDATPKGYLDFATDRVTGTPIVRQRIDAEGYILMNTTTDNGSTNILQVNGGFNYNIVFKTSTATAYTLLLADVGKYFALNSTSAIAITIPLNATTALPIGSIYYFVQRNTGVPTFTGEAGVTLRTRSSVRQPFAQYSEVKLVKVGTDEWYLTGDLKA